MKAIIFKSAVTNRQGGFNFCVGRQFQRRLSPRDRKRRPRQERNAEFLSGIVHRLRVIPAIRQMFIIEDRDHLITSAENSHDVIEESTTRIHPLACLRSQFILSMFGNTENSCDLQPIRSESQRVVDGFGNPETMQLRLLTTHVLRGNLIGEQGNKFKVRTDSTILVIPLKDLACDDVSMTVRCINRNHRSYRQLMPRSSGFKRRQRPCVRNG